jgi:hypothetical protein
MLSCPEARSLRSSSCRRPRRHPYRRHRLTVIPEPGNPVELTGGDTAPHRRHSSQTRRTNAQVSVKPGGSPFHGCGHQSRHAVGGSALASTDRCFEFLTGSDLIAPDCLIRGRRPTASGRQQGFSPPVRDGSRPDGTTQSVPGG